MYRTVFWTLWERESAGSQHGESRLWQRLWGRGLIGDIRPQGNPPEPSWASTPKPESKTHTRGSPRWDTLCYSSGRLWPYVDGVSLLSEALLAFYVNQGIQPLSLLYSFNCKLFPYLSLNLNLSLTTLSLLQITLDPTKAGPWQERVGWFGRMALKHV